MIQKNNLKTLIKNNTMSTKNKFVAWLIKVGHSNTFFKIGITIIALIITFIPIYLFCLIRWIFGPEGFWQEICLLAIAGPVLVPAQIILGIFGVIFICSVIADKH